MISDPVHAGEAIEYPSQFARQEYKVFELERKSGTSAYICDADSSAHPLEDWPNILTLDQVTLRRAWEFRQLLPTTSGYSLVLKAI